MTWLTDTLIVTGVLIALVLLLRRPVAKGFGPGAAYALWLLPLLRLVLPPLQLPAAAADLPAPTVTEVVTVMAEPIPAIAAAAPAWTYAPLFQAGWLLGAALYLAWRAWGYAEMRRELLSGAINVGDTEGVRLMESPAARAPVAFGVFDKVIALPPGFMALTPLAERDLALEHELEHHRGRDLAINIAVQPLLALHWFNPLGWLGWKALRRDQEAACDARVLAGREAETRAVYGRLIASFAVHPSPALASPLACPINLEKSIIYRLRSLTMTEPTKTRRLAGRLLIGAAALALPLTATISYAANEPAPPAPPAPPVHPAGVQAHEVLIETVGKSEAGQPPKIRKIVIVEKSSDGGDLVTRTETRGERTYVFKTAKPLSDAEVEKRIAGIDQGQMVSADKFVVSAAPDGAKRADQTVVIRHGDGLAPEKKVERREVRTAITHFESSGNVVAAVLPECPTGTRSTHVQTADEGQGGKTRHVRVVVCAHDGDPQGRLHGLRSARAKVADNPDIPAETKTEVLGQLDAEIEKAAKAG